MSESQQAWEVAARALRALAKQINADIERPDHHSVPWAGMNENAKLSRIADACNDAGILSLLDILAALRAHGLEDLIFRDDPDEPISDSQAAAQRMVREAQS